MAAAGSVSCCCCCVEAPNPVLAPKPPPGVAPGVACPNVPPPVPKPVVVERPNPVDFWSGCVGARGHEKRRRSASHTPSYLHSTGGSFVVRNQSIANSNARMRASIRRTYRQTTWPPAPLRASQSPGKQGLARWMCAVRNCTAAAGPCVMSGLYYVVRLGASAVGALRGYWVISSSNKGVIWRHAAALLASSSRRAHDDDGTTATTTVDRDFRRSIRPALCALSTESVVWGMHWDACLHARMPASTIARSPSSPTRASSDRARA